MAIQKIDIGQSANDKKGDSLRQGAQKINASFDYLDELIVGLGSGQGGKAYPTLADALAAGIPDNVIFQVDPGSEDEGIWRRDSSNPDGAVFIKGLYSLTQNLLDLSTIKFNSAVPRDGVFPADNLRDVSDWIDVEGLNKVKIYTTDNRLIVGSIFFYTDKNNSSSEWIVTGSSTNYVTEFETLVPDGAKWAIVQLRREIEENGEIAEYTGDTFVVEADVKNKVNVDLKVDERVKKDVAFTKDFNIFHGRVFFDKAPPENGVFPDNTTRDVTDFINIEGATYIKMSTTDGKLVSGGIALYKEKTDAERTDIGDYQHYAEEVILRIPEGYKYAVAIVRRLTVGENLPYNGDTLVVQADVPDERSGITVVGETFYPFLSQNGLEVISERIKSLNPILSLNVDLRSKNLAIFTSSNGDPDYGNWPVDVASHFGMNLLNEGVAGATYVHQSEGHNSIVNIIEDFSASNPETPDLILFNTGMNDSWHKNAVMGDFDAVLNQDLATIRSNFTNNDYGIHTFYGAMRWCFETVQQNYPDAQIMVIVPFQAWDARSRDFLKLIEPIKKMAAWHSIPVIDAFNEGGISSAFEPEGQMGRYTVDGVHTKYQGVVNPAGRTLQRNFLTSEIIRKYYPKK